MADMNALHDQLKNLRDRAVELASTVLSLGTVLTEEANQLSREDEVSRLKVVYSSTRQQLDIAKRSEDSARYGHSKANLIFSLARLGLSATAMVSKNKQLSTISRHLVENPISKERPFGNVLVYIGPDGLPNDVEVVSVSRLARESNRPESEVINKLRARGCLLFSKEEFSLLVDKLVIGVREGRLHLPISKENLSEITLSSQSTLRAKKME
jgi:hypothetical protein